MMNSIMQMSVLSYMLCVLFPLETVLGAQGTPKTFGRGIPNFPFTNNEVEIFSYNISAGASIGVINHFWSTACGGKENFITDAGVSLYRFYIDGETEASVQFTPRMATGGYFDPVPAAAPSPNPGPNEHDGNRTDNYIVGGKGETCDAACESVDRTCHPTILPSDTTEQQLGELFQSLLPFDTASNCVIDSQDWFAEDQPSYVYASNNSNFGKCLGTRGTPKQIFCNGSHPLVQRLCRCTKFATPSRSRYSEMDSVDQDNNPSARVPWGTDLIGKTSDMDGYYVNIQIPFYKTVRVTAQLPPGHGPFQVYTIIRGTENVPVQVNGFTLPPQARLQTVSTSEVQVPSLAFVPIVNMTKGSGLVFGHTVAIDGNPMFTYLEGCFHLITPFTLPMKYGVGANFPGITLSTGMEDYYDSSFYFHAGLFQLGASGVVHMCSGRPGSFPHPLCPQGNTSKWSAYRFHHKDPLFFESGVQLVFRNGDVADRTSYGSGKCYNLDMGVGGPGLSTISTLAWVYVW
eukprot:m.143394 g.143394  ORF g.143394 m.143394 type:complete len:516 (+) comp30316_c0_seq3:97-1644(+)